MKICIICKIEKNENEYGIDKRTKDNLNISCKGCIRLRSKMQRQNNPEYYKRYAKRYREDNKEELRKKAFINYYIDWEKRAEQSKKYYEKHKQKIAKKRAERSRLSEAKELNRKRQSEWRKENRTHVGQVVTEWKQKNPQKAAAHALVLWAVRSGMLTKPEICEECKMNKKLEGHHEDYLNPLVVKWLCKSCHSEKHRIYK